MTVRPSELSAVQLQFLPVAGAYRTKAFAQLTTKALFLTHTGTPVAFEVVRRHVADLAGVANVPEDEVRAALEFMQRRGWCLASDDRYCLSPDGLRLIEIDLEEHRRLLDRVLEGRFPAAIARETLRAWFTSTFAQYFVRLGNDAVASIFRTTQPGREQLFIPDVVERTANAHGLGEHRTALCDGFREVISGPSPDEQRLIWSGCQAAFSARLISAGVGADPITADLLRDAMVLLDTTILVTATSEAPREDSALRALARGFTSLGLDVSVLPATCEEYRRLVESDRDQVARVLDGVGIRSLRKVTNALVRSAVDLGCKSREDFDRFFESVEDPLRAIAEVTAVRLCEDKDIVEAAEAGEHDAALCESVQSAWSRTRARPKRPQAVEHDAGMIAAVESIRSAGVNAWVLSEDMTMCELASQRAGPRSLPSWISSYALVEVLAVDGAGPGLTAEDAGKLLASMLENDLHPVVGTYTVEDLAWLASIDANASELDEKTIDSVAISIARARVRGRPLSDPDFLMEMNRALQRGRARLETERDVAVIGRSSAEEALRTERGERIRVQEQLGTRITADQRRATWRRFAVGVLVVTLAALTSLGAGMWLLTLGDSALQSVGAVLIPSAVITAPLEVVRRVKAYRKAVASLAHG